MHALQKTPLGEGGIVLPFLNTEQELEFLRRRNQELEQENNSLHITVASREVAIRNIAQKYFAIDDKSRLLASGGNGLVDEKSALRHWQFNGGPEGFSRHFPTAAHVVRYFMMAHSVRGRMIELGLT